VSVADVAWFASYVLLCAALWVVLSRSREDGRADRGFVVDAVTIVVVSVLVFWRFTVDAIVVDDSVSPIVRAVWAAYPVLDAVLLALVLRVLLSRSARAALDIWFAAGVCLWLAADILYVHATDHQAAMITMNAAWMVAPILMARAAWVHTGAAPVAERLPTAPGAWVTQLVIAVCPLLAPPALELIADLRGQEDRPWQLLIGMAAVMALAFVRTARLLLSEQRAHRELEVARDAALAASEAKSMFLANMSHEIRTPLTTLLVSAELLKNTPLNDLQRSLVGRMDRNGDRLRSLVEGLLDFSRIEARQTVLQSAEFDLQEMVTDILDAHLARARRQGVRFGSQVDPRVPRSVIGDRNRVFQVVNNLVDNALKFTEDGHVHLDVRPVQGDEQVVHHMVQFSVADTGIGIRKEDLASVFESFSQVDPTATRRYQGVGLGLAICKELTELMGGNITASSELGVGSTFTIRLPLAPTDPGQETGSGDGGSVRSVDLPPVGRVVARPLT
jgi:signal transduction histidine kinase